MYFAKCLKTISHSQSRHCCPPEGLRRAWAADVVNLVVSAINVSPWLVFVQNMWHPFIPCTVQWQFYWAIKWPWDHMPSKRVAPALCGGRSPVVLPSTCRPSTARGCSWGVLRPVHLASGATVAASAAVIFSTRVHLLVSLRRLWVPQQSLPLRLSKFIQNRWDYRLQMH